MTFGEVSGRGRNVGLGVGQFGEGEGRLKFLSGPARRLTAREVVPPVISHNGSRSRNGGGSVCGTGHAGIPSALSVYLTLAVVFGSGLATRRQLSGSSSSLSATRGRLRLESSFHLSPLFGVAGEGADHDLREPKNLRRVPLCFLGASVNPRFIEAGTRVRRLQNRPAGRTSARVRHRGVRLARHSRLHADTP